MKFQDWLETELGNNYYKNQKDENIWKWVQITKDEYGCTVKLLYFVSGNKTFKYVSHKIFGEHISEIQYI